MPLLDTARFMSAVGQTDEVSTDRNAKIHKGGKRAMLELYEDFRETFSNYNFLF